jgi:two-component system, cell cycle sensor histidine kinase and response regulator CckA
LEESQNRNREQAALLDKARDGILVCDLNNCIVYWNQGAERIYGWSAAEATGQDFTQLLFQGRPPVQLQESLRSINERGEWVGELDESTRDGRIIIVQVRATLIRDETGKPKSFLLINTDVTESKQLEEKFLRAQRMESLGILVSGIAHDLDNALAPVLFGVAILRKDSTADEGLLTVMEKSARHGAELVKQILAFARGTDAKKMPMDVGQILKEMGKVVEETFPRNIRCQLKLGQDLWPVSAVATQIYQVLMNLCINAKDAMPKGGQLTLAAQNAQVGPELATNYPAAKPGNYLCVSITDTGSGIPPAQLAKIFEPFFTTKPVGKGTGLGLSTSSDIIKSHGGFMVVSSKVDEGTEFKFYLPATVKEHPTILTEEPSLPSGHGECVLVVDDEATVVALAHTALENFGYRVKAASSACEAIARLDDNKKIVQLIIVDLNMPFMSSLTTTVALHKTRNHLKMIVTGGTEKDLSKDMCEQLRVDAFLPKPFTMEKLLKTIHDVLTEKE